MCFNVLSTLALISFRRRVGGSRAGRRKKNGGGRKEEVFHCFLLSSIARFAPSVRSDPSVHDGGGGGKKKREIGWGYIADRRRRRDRQTNDVIERREGDCQRREERGERERERTVRGERRKRERELSERGWHWGKGIKKLFQQKVVGGPLPSILAYLQIALETQSYVAR